MLICGPPQRLAGAGEHHEHSWETETFVAQQHAEKNTTAEPEFISCFNEDAEFMDYATAYANWPSRPAGELTAQTPEAGYGHYAYLRPAKSALVSTVRWQGTTWWHPTGR